MDVSWKRKHQEQQQQQGAGPTNTQAAQAHGGAGAVGTSQKKPKHNLPEYRTILYKYCDKQAMPTPLYETTNDGSGFTSLVTVFIPSSGTSPNKKASEQSAAYMALFFLKQLEKESWMDEVNAAGMPIDKDSPANEINDKKCTFFIFFMIYEIPSYRLLRSIFIKFRIYLNHVLHKLCVTLNISL